MASPSASHGSSYAIDFIFGKMRDWKTREIKYAVKWEGFTLDDTSWEPQDHFFNGTEKVVRRFERVQAYNMFYHQVKRSQFSGIRVHSIGPFVQLFAPTYATPLRQIKAPNKMEDDPARKDRDQFLEKFFDLYDQSASVSVAPGRQTKSPPGTKFEDGTEQVPQKKRFAGLSKEPIVAPAEKEVKREKYRVFQKEESQQRDINGSSRYKSLVKTDGQFGTKEEMKALGDQSNKPKYRILQQTAQSASQAPDPANVPRVKTEREYLFEIVEKQRLKEQGQAKVQGKSVQRNGGSSDDTIKYIVKKSCFDDDNGTTVPDEAEKKLKNAPVQPKKNASLAPTAQQASTTKTKIASEPPTFTESEVQCDLGSEKLEELSCVYEVVSIPKLESGMQKHGAHAFPKVRPLDRAVSVFQILGHYILEDETTRKLKILFHVEQNVFVSYTFLCDNSPLLMLSYMSSLGLYL